MICPRLSVVPAALGAMPSVLMISRIPESAASVNWAVAAVGSVTLLNAGSSVQRPSLSIPPLTWNSSTTIPLRWNGLLSFPIFTVS